MSPAFNGSSTLEHFEHSNVIEQNNAQFLPGTATCTFLLLTIFSPSGSGSSHASLPTTQLSASQKRGGTPPPDGYFMRGVPQGSHNMATPTHATSGEPSSSGTLYDTDI